MVSARQGGVILTRFPWWRWWRAWRLRAIELRAVCAGNLFTDKELGPIGDSYKAS
jgi:hypothetical protein